MHRCRNFQWNRSTYDCYSDLKIWTVGIDPHLGFHGRWISIAVWPLQTHSATKHKIIENISKIEQSNEELELQQFEDWKFGAVRHLWFDQKWILRIPPFLWIHNASLYEILAKSDNPQLRSISNQASADPPMCNPPAPLLSVLTGPCASILSCSLNMVSAAACVLQTL